MIYKKKKTVLHLIDSFNSGGAETLIKSYIPLLPHYKHLVVVFEQTDEILPKDYLFINLNLHPKKNFFRIVLSLKKLITENKVDIVHSHSYWSNILSRLSTPSYLKVINHYHFSDYDTLSRTPSVRRMIFVDKFIGHKNLVRIAVSNYVGKILSKTFKICNPVILTNFVIPSSDNRYALKNGINNLKVVAVGHCNKEKNYNVILDAFKLLRNKPITIDIIGGGGLLTYLKNEVDKQQLDNIKFLGSVLWAPKFLPNYNLYLSTSKLETFGMASIEAMAAGLPLLLSKIPAFLEVAEDYAIFFDPDDPIDLANKLEEFLMQKYKFPEKDFYKDRLAEYSKDKFIKNFNAIYQFTK